MSDRPKIVVTNRIHDDVVDRLAAVGRVEVNDSLEPWNEAALEARLADADAMMGFMTDRVDARLLAAAPRLRAVACALKGYDSYDVDACTRAGVWVSIVPDLLTAPTAELAVGLAIGLARHVREGDALVRGGGFRGWRARLYGSGLEGSVVGIVGMGAVGRAIARRLQGFDSSRLIGADPLSPACPGVTSGTLEQVLDESDVVFLAAPLTPVNRHMIDAGRLARCRPGQHLVNVGRGSVVDERAVADALEQGRLGGYAADVFEFEDWALSDRPAEVDPALRAAPNTLFTPHLGSAVRGVRRAIEHRAADNLVAVLQGRVPADAINSPIRARTPSPLG